MTIFNEREQAFEARFARDGDLAFLKVARRNRALGLWAAERLGLDADAASSYADNVQGTAVGEGTDDAMIARLLADLHRKRETVTEKDLRTRMADLEASTSAPG